MAAKRYLPVFPGEHYRLLASLVQSLAPQAVIEIGTFTGLSALAMLATLPAGATITTYDVIPWQGISNSALRDSDFSGGRLEQRVGDLAEDDFFRANADVITNSQLIFVDGPKDAKFEPKFLRLLLAARRPQRAVLVFDDIRTWNMLNLWHSLELEKLDITSFGHWSGTGICLLPADRR
jgi:predicted O-methyltransferase YrrM